MLSRARLRGFVIFRLFRHAHLAPPEFGPYGRPDEVRPILVRIQDGRDRGKGSRREPRLHHLNPVLPSPHAAGRIRHLIGGQIRDQNLEIYRP